MEHRIYLFRKFKSNHMAFIIYFPLTIKNHKESRIKNSKEIQVYMYVQLLDIFFKKKMMQISHNFNRLALRIQMISILKQGQLYHVQRQITGLYHSTAHQQVQDSFSQALSLQEFDSNLKWSMAAISGLELHNTFQFGENSKSFTKFCGKRPIFLIADS